MNDLPAKRSSGELVTHYEDAESVTSVLRRVTRLGPWEPPETMRLLSVMGDIVLDYREAELPLGLTTVECRVIMGNVEIIVPPDVDVELLGSVFLGNVETRGGTGSSGRRAERARLVDPAPDEDEYERPLLRLECSGLMGNVEVELP